MSNWRTVSSTNECDADGCPSEITVTRRARKGEINGDAIPAKEMLAALKQLGWKVGKSYAHDTICPDCRLKE
jgi:hypothetical protein